MSTIGEAISRVRGTLTAVNHDSFITDRLIHNMLVTRAKYYIKQRHPYGRKAQMMSLFTRLGNLELIETSKVDACISIDLPCTIKRTKDKIPAIIDGPNGPLIRGVMSVDGATEIYQVTPQEWERMTRTSGFKYNKQKYYWIVNQYIFLPNVSWETISIEAMFEGDVTGFKCDDECAFIQSQPFGIPSELLAIIEDDVVQRLANREKINMDLQPSDKQSPIR